VRITFNFNLAHGPILPAVVTAFQRARSRDDPEMPIGIYLDLKSDDQLALTRLQIVERHGA
jgi:hypothetical protein